MRWSKVVAVLGVVLVRGGGAVVKVTVLGGVEAVVVEEVEAVVL